MQEDVAPRCAPRSSLVVNWLSTGCNRWSAGCQLAVNWWCDAEENPKNSRILDGELEELVDITLDGQLEELVDITLDGELEELVWRRRQAAMLPSSP